MNRLGVILLAAGLGKRMNSALPKVLHSLGGKPLFMHALKAARGLDPEKIAVVVGHGAELVRQACREDGIEWVIQERQLGTGHAVASAGEAFDGFSGTVVILSGDVPSITRETLARLLASPGERNPALTFVTARLAEPRGYGRVLRDAGGKLRGIVEERDATEAEKKIGEINAGVYAVSAGFLFPALAGLTNANRQNEYYLTDIVGAALRRGETVTTVEAGDAGEIMGINTREELALMEKILQHRINRKWMEAGVTLKDPQTTYIEEGVRIGRDTVIGPNTHLLRGSAA